MDFVYKIIGGDGKEYGPVSRQELLTWLYCIFKGYQALRELKSASS